MPVTDLPYTDEISSFRRRLMEVLNDRCNSLDEDSLDEDADKRLCSEREAPASRSAAMAGQLAPPSQPPEQAERSILLEEVTSNSNGEFLPLVPHSLSKMGIRHTDIESIILKFLLNSGAHFGSEIAKQIRVPLSLIGEPLRSLKEERLVVYKKTGSAGDYLYELTEVGIERARRYWEHCTYFGSVPVSLKDYIASVAAQSVRKQNPKWRVIQQVFSDLSVTPEMIIRLAQAVNSGLGLFLFGAPGNGKTLMASRLARAFGETVWIPRALNVGGCIMRLYDPSNHVPAPLTPEGQRDLTGVDERWIRICRPTMVVGGELTLDSFEVRTDSTTGVSEAPIQLKSNCGVLVIDDFGRQRVTPTEILNRWIVPLAQRFDILHLRNGRKFEFPIDQLVVFSTNLEPKALVDEAFLRRIPYKIDVQNPSENEFRALLKKTADEWGIKYQEAPVDYLIEKYYKSCQREMRYCHPGDILHQVGTFCNVLELPLEISNQAIDAAAKNYFTLL